MALSQMFEQVCDSLWSSLVEHAGDALDELFTLTDLPVMLISSVNLKESTKFKTPTA